MNLLYLIFSKLPNLWPIKCLLRNVCCHEYDIYIDVGTCRYLSSVCSVVIGNTYICHNSHSSYLTWIQYLGDDIFVPLGNDGKPLMDMESDFIEVWKVRFVFLTKLDVYRGIWHATSLDLIFKMNSIIQLRVSAEYFSVTFHLLIYRSEH